MGILVTGVVALILGILLDFLLETILTWCLEISFQISTAILDPSTFSFALNNGEKGLLTVLPAIKNFDILQFFKTIAWILLFLIVIINVIKALTSGLSGNLTKSPIQYVLGGLTAAVLLVLFFGIGDIQGLIYWFGEKVFNPFMEWATKDMLGANGKLALSAQALSAQVKTAMGRSSIVFSSAVDSEGKGNQIVNVVFAIAIMSGCIGASITHVERYLSLALYILFGPVCIAFYGTDETKDTAREWFMGIISQCIAMLLGIICWRMFFVQVTKDWTLFNLAITLAILSMIKNSEQILNMVGFRTMPSKDSARSLLGAAASTGALAIGAISAIGGISRGIGRGVDRKLANTQNAQRGLYEGINNAKTEREVQAAKAKYKSETAGITNKFKGKDPDKAYTEAQQKWGAVPTAKEEIKAQMEAQKKVIDNNCAQNIKNAKNFGEVQNALQARDAAYSKLPNSPQPSILQDSFIGPEGRQMKIDMAKNLSSLSNDYHTNGNIQLDAEKAAQLADFNMAIFGDKNGLPHTAYTPSVNDIISNQDSSMLIPQLAIPDVPEDARNSPLKWNVEGVQQFNELTLGNLDRLDKGTLSDALNLSDYGYDENGTIRGHVDGLAEDAAVAVGISELVNLDTGETGLYAIMPSDLSLPDNATFSCDIGDDYNSAKYFQYGNDAIQIGEGIKAVPLTLEKEPSVDSSVADENIHDLFTNI